MFKKISLLVFLSVPLIILADGHGKKEGKSPQEMKRMEMMKNKEAHMKKEMERWGRWKPEDCKKVSDSSGAFLYYSGLAIDASERLEKGGRQHYFLSDHPKTTPRPSQGRLVTLKWQGC